VDCWWTEVSNLYVMDGDGRFMRRVGFDQVHTNYPTTLDDGRVIYTRWDYHDRGQIYPQPLFQMNADGTAQREYYGNSSYFPTTIMHARGIPGTQKVVAVMSGHHNHQRGKLGVIDVSKGRQEEAGVTLLAPVRPSSPDRIDSWGQDGDQFMHPWPLGETEFLVGYDPYGGGNRNYTRPYGLYWMHADGRRELLAWDPAVSSTQPVPLAPRPVPHLRPSMVDYRRDHGTYYVQDVYAGPGLAGIDRGTVKRLRVVALEFRPAGIGNNSNRGEAGGALVSTPPAIDNGTWDVKRVLGSVPVEEDGSAFFRVPARTPVYFQLLDDRNRVVQTMRTWSTLQPGEHFSCVGCHEDKDAVAPATGRATRALAAGPRDLDPFQGPARGFSFLREIQPILDAKCVECHTGGEKPDGSLAPFSLLSRRTRGATPNSRREWTESYVNLTRNGEINDVVNWISPQSPPSMLPPYHAGSARSKLIDMLAEGHEGIEVTGAELERIACWIDLLVPFCGDYAEANAWSEAEKAKYEHFAAKRARLTAEDRANIEAYIRERHGEQDIAAAEH